ncbi:RICIN domain-containing protein [Streptomyces sp. NBC_00654]|uniref:RICIN domain-containing protein n=1 Tax=Streptomyces sp. NBC_00654 TaxID=2975799 RepID=UPI00224DD9C1|nr:RICIN domain-containing protein [Streptomyces sp. NBC_00654]MCX4966937.1 RICIN domain-containing protein [Streptomyces sp. NBC_00654]
MSDQHKASGEPSVQQEGSAEAEGVAAEAGTAVPEAGTVAADLLGRGQPRAGSAPAPEGGSGEAARSTGSTRSPASPGTGSGATGAAVAEGGSAEAAEEAGASTASEAESAEAKGGRAGAAQAGEADGADASSAAEKAREGQPAGVARARNTRRGVAAAARSGGAAAGTGTGEPGRPGKPVLAGAALVGAILIAIPLLVMVTGKDEDKKAVKSAAVENVLEDEDDLAGAFVAESPAPSRTKPGKENKKGKAGPKTAEEAASPAAPPSPSSGAKPEQGKGKGELKSRTASNLPPVLSRVLIKNNTNGTCVDIPGYSKGAPDTEVHHFTCDNTSNDNQLWNVEQRYTSAGPGGVPLFQIRNVKDGMCLDLPGYGGGGEATMVTEYPCDGTMKDNQLWWLDKRADGKYWIRNAASNNQCLDSYSRSEKERQLLIWPCAPESQNNHEWVFTRS